MMKREQNLKKLIKAYDSYIELLCGELNDLVGLISVRGWQSTRYEAGCKCRKKIKKLKKEVL